MNTLVIGLVAIQAMFVTAIVILLNKEININKKTKYMELKIHNKIER